jgi:hypothetical protein
MITGSRAAAALVALAASLARLVVALVGLLGPLGQHFNGIRDLAEQCARNVSASP